MENLVSSFLLGEAFGFWFKIVALIILFTLVSVLVIAFFTGVGSKDFKEKRGKLIILLLIFHTLGVVGTQVLSPKNWFSKASSSAEPYNLQVDRLAGDQHSIELKTNKSVLAYLEYQDLEDGSISQVFATSGSKETKEHSFLIPNTGKKGIKIWLVIQGKKYPIGDEAYILGKQDTLN